MWTLSQWDSKLTDNETWKNIGDMEENHKRHAYKADKLPELFLYHKQWLTNSLLQFSDVLSI